ncbi:MAG TPA: multiheme c-type cytochrome, partial [Polyangiaceae bacterium]|nr:multiheme c-type cytochrome [Polyangiaceae bacterium]
ALACGSEDLLTFGVVEGLATDILRHPAGCDHPVGLALDDTGQRIFVNCDQSHTLLTIDTGGGSLVAHARLFGDPIKVVAGDPVDPELRFGETLFFRANADKGDLATTGDNWMSCGGCHLDGFGSSNARLFEAIAPADPGVDAQIGHVGLRDHFLSAEELTATDGGAPDPTAPAFDPHDVLVALLDQGGLAPDRTGAVRDGQIDPAAPTAEAAMMARALGRVVARDLPNGPAWLRSDAAPDVSWDGAFCGRCHAAEYAAWTQSAHAHAGEDPMVLFCVGVEQQQVGAPYSRFCAGCHDPVGARTGDVSFGAGRGVTCVGCHDVEREIRAGGNADLKATSHDWVADHKTQALASLDKLRQPEFCGGCHQQFVPGGGLVALSTLDEYHASPYAGKVRCVDCHMRADASGIGDHRFPGGNVYLGLRFGSGALVQAQRANLSQAVSLDAQPVPGGVLVTVHNTGAGHGFPTGVTDLREPWVELQPIDAGGRPIVDGQGNIVRVGGPATIDSELPAGAARLGIDVADQSGALLLRHELTQATRIPFDVRVPAGGAQSLFIATPAALPAGAVGLDAVLEYRNVRTTYFRAVAAAAAAAGVDAGDPDGAAPMIEVARTRVAAP